MLSFQYPCAVKSDREDLTINTYSLLQQIGLQDLCHYYGNESRGVNAPFMQIIGSVFMRSSNMNIIVIIA